MRCVLMTPLGDPVEPEVNRSLAIVSGPTFAWAASTSGAGGVSARIGRTSPRASRRRVGARDDLDVPRHGRVDRRAKGAPSLTKTRPGVRMSMIVLSLAKSLATSE